VSDTKTDERPRVAAIEAERPAAAEKPVAAARSAAAKTPSIEELKPLVGEWKWTQKSADGNSEVDRRFKLTLNNGKLGGTIFGGEFGQFKIADLEIASAEFNDGHITLVTDNGRTTTYEGVVQGDSIKGTSIGTGRDGKPLKRAWNATRVVEAAKKN